VHELGLVLFTNCLLKIFGEVKRLMMLFRGHGYRVTLLCSHFYYSKWWAWRSAWRWDVGSDAMFLWCFQGCQTFWHKAINIMFVGGTTLIVVMIVKGLITYLLVHWSWKVFPKYAMDFGHRNTLKRFTGHKCASTKGMCFCFIFRASKQCFFLSEITHFFSLGKIVSTHPKGFGEKMTLICQILREFFFK
jgi:hypothetical protein